MKFLTVNAKKVKASAGKVKEGDGRMGQFKTDMMYENKKAGAA